MIKFKLDTNELKRFTNEIIEEWESEVLQSLISICDEAIELQWVQFRPEGYNDQTGQLRSSTGYIIYHNGKIVKERFELSAYGTDKSPGLKAGKEYAFSILRESDGWGIIFVVGMEYASYVQGKGFSALKHAEVIFNKGFYESLDRIVLK